MSQPLYPLYVVPATASCNPRQQSFLHLGSALISCHEQLIRTVEALSIVVDKLDGELACPLRRGAWALLANQVKALSHRQLDAARVRLLALTTCTSQFQSAIELMTQAHELLDDSTCQVAEQSVRRHIEVCRDNLAEISTLVGQLDSRSPRQVA